MSRWTVNTEVNRTCPLRTVVRVADKGNGWADEHMDCGHTWPQYTIKARVGRRRRCIPCREAVPPTTTPEAP